MRMTWTALRVGGLACLLACLASSPAAAESDFRRGDTNADGSLDLGDAIHLLNHLFTSPRLACEDAADINDDGSLDLGDPISLLNYLFADGGAPAAPFDACGADPTPDDLSCGSFPPCPAETPLPGDRLFRAVAGISMGGFGAMNLGTRRDDLFGVIGSLGGPVDLRELLRHMVEDNLEVKAQMGLPRQSGSDFTFDHLPPYPDRDTRMTMVQDLCIAFGNPFLHHTDPAAQYFARDAEPASIRRDDVLGSFDVPADPRGFLDGGDENSDGVRQIGEAPDRPVDVLLLAQGSLASIAPGAAGTAIGGRALADLDGDGIYDAGDGIVINVSEPGTADAFDDVGLDGVPGTGDFGEGNGRFDEDPDVANWLDEDPVTRLRARERAAIEAQRIYMDVGTEDEFAFEPHYSNLVAVLRGKGIEVEEWAGFPWDCTAIPRPEAPFLLARYEGGHIGIPEVDGVVEELLEGDICGPAVIWGRLATLLGYLDQSFPDGFLGPGGVLRVVGEIAAHRVPSPALGPAGSPVERTVVVYKPAAFFNTDQDFPIVYFLGGYGQAPEDFLPLDQVFDALMALGEIQSMYFAFLPGDGGRKGCFYVNHRIPHDQALIPAAEATTGRYEDSIVQDLMPAIEREILEGRIKR